MCGVGPAPAPDIHARTNFRENGFFFTEKREFTKSGKGGDSSGKNPRNFEKG